MVPSLTLSAEAAQTEAQKKEEAAKKEAAKKEDAKKKGEDDELDEVNITGTRIQVPGNYTAPNPMTTIGKDELDRLGFVNVADALLQLVPQNVSTYSPLVTGDDQSEVAGTFSALDRSSFFIGNTIANLRGLDPTFGSRTLTMIDGRRVVSTSNQADVVDMNIIPSNMLQRMDVVTGGASATYGSGAVAGVVNLVLNNRQRGFSLDMDYGVNEAGDGGSPHVSASYGWSMFGGKGNAVISGEWQDSSSIRDCAAARDWCKESRFLFTNGAGTAVNGRLSPLPGFEGFPGRFEMANVRYSQFAPGGTIYHNSVNNIVGYRFELNPDTNQVGVEEYAYGYRGGAGTSNVMNGDGPLVTTGTSLRTGQNRKTFYSSFEYNITERTTAYMNANFAQTHATNKNRYTRGDYCVRFNSTGTAGTNSEAGAVWVFATSVAGSVDGTNYSRARDTHFTAGFGGNFTNAVATFLGLPGGTNSSYITGNGFGPAGISTSGNQRAVAFPFWIPTDGQYGQATVPNFNFNNKAVGKWVRFSFSVYDQATYTPGSSTNFYAPGYSNSFWLLDQVTLTEAWDGGTATVLPGRGRNEYAFLNTLDAEAFARIQSSFNNSPTTGSGVGTDTLYGANACSGFTAVRKVWNPQFDRWTEQTSETKRVVAGIRGRFGRDWRWDAYYQWGKTDSRSEQNNVATTIRTAFAIDAVIDDRINPNGTPFDQNTFGKPICRIVRDGVPVLDTAGRPLSNYDDLVALTEGCQPLNVFGTTFRTTEDALRQQAAIDYAFVESTSAGSSGLQTLAMSTNGTLWQGWGAGPMTGAFSVEMRKNEVNNPGTLGRPYYERADLSSSWSDGFGGSTTTTEGSAEFNLPLVSNVPGVNLWSVNAAVRYTSDLNKGGIGTTGQKNRKDTFNWKFSSVFEPFDYLRFRLTRSRDLRAPDYRSLFASQPGIPDQFSFNNPWRERTAASTENQQDRAGQVGVGNPLLRPETSNTLTIGLVLSPSGWAQGLRFTADYYNIQVKDGITTPFSAETPYTSCWEGSGNRPDQYVDGEIAPDSDGVNGLFNLDYQAPDGTFPCREIEFARTTADAQGAILLDYPGTDRDGYYSTQDLVAYNSRRPQNSLPFQRRGLDLSLSYMFPLSRAFEELPGNISLTIRAQRALESSGVQLAAFPFNIMTRVDLTGQLRSNTFIPGVSAGPLWTGNIIMSYLVGDLTTSLSARYIGGAKQDKLLCDAGQQADGLCNTYMDAQGRLLNGSIDNNWVKPYMNWSLNAQYNLKVGDMKQFQVYGSVNNLFNKTPPFTGGGISGATAGYHDTLGRAYRMGVRLKF